MSLNRNIKDLIPSDLTINDILEVVGLRRHSAMRRMLPSVGLVLAGAVVGGAIALLLAPESGEKLRGHIGQRLRRNEERAQA
jgi:hypothetical protein